MRSSLQKRENSLIDSFRNTMKGKAIVKFWLGPVGVYVITGAKNVQYVLRSSGSLSSKKLITMAFRQIAAFSKEDLAKFERDKSGMSHVPSIEIPEEERVWAPFHRIFMDHMTNTKAVGVMAAKFCELFSETLSRQSRAQWQTVRVYEFLEQEMVRCAITSLSGSHILEQNPDLIDAMWRFDEKSYALLLGVPRFLSPKSYAARDAFHEMGEKHLSTAWSKFDWDNEEYDPDWEPIFGARFSRVHSKFLKDKGVSMRARSGLYLGTLWAYIFPNYSFVQS